MPWGCSISVSCGHGSVALCFPITTKMNKQHGKEMWKMTDTRESRTHPDPSPNVRHVISHGFLNLNMHVCFQTSVVHFHVFIMIWGTVFFIFPLDYKLTCLSVHQFTVRGVDVDSMFEDLCVCINVCTDLKPEVSVEDWRGVQLASTKGK